MGVEDQRKGYTHISTHPHKKQVRTADRDCMSLENVTNGALGARSSCGDFLSSIVLSCDRCTIVVTAHAR